MVIRWERQRKCDWLFVDLCEHANMLCECFVSVRVPTSVMIYGSFGYIWGKRLILQNITTTVDTNYLIRYCFNAVAWLM